MKSAKAAFEFITRVCNNAGFEVAPRLKQVNKITVGYMQTNTVRTAPILGTDAEVVVFSTKFGDSGTVHTTYIRQQGSGTKLGTKVIDSMHSSYFDGIRDVILGKQPA